MRAQGLNRGGYPAVPDQGNVKRGRFRFFEKWDRASSVFEVEVRPQTRVCVKRATPVVGHVGSVDKVGVTFEVGDYQRE